MRLFAGSINLTGVLEVTVTGVGEKTALGRVLICSAPPSNRKHPRFDSSNNMQVTMCRSF